MGSTYNGMPQLKSLSCNVVNQDNSSSSGSAVISQVLNSMSLHSWVYPQSTLPPFIVSALVASGSDRGFLLRVHELCLLISHHPSEFYKEILILLFLGENNFLQNRKLAWEDAFRSLYYMFRKNLCKIFYGNSIFFLPDADMTFLLVLRTALMKTTSMALETCSAYILLLHVGGNIFRRDIDSSAFCLPLTLLFRRPRYKTCFYFSVLAKMHKSQVNL